MNAKVRAGDLLLFRVSASSNWLDKLIGWGQKVIHEAPTDAAYCHVAIVGPTPNRMYEAVWPRVHNVEIDLTFIQKSLIIEVYRVTNQTPEGVARVMAYLENQIGTWYPVSAILTFGMVTFGNRPYCSELAWRAELEDQKVLCPDDDRMITPDEIAASPLLTRVV